jgi:hypothetical protein
MLLLVVPPCAIYIDGKGPFWASSTGGLQVDNGRIVGETRHHHRVGGGVAVSRKYESDANMVPGLNVEPTAPCW